MEKAAAGLSEEDGGDNQAMAKFIDFSLKQIQAMVDLVRTQLDKQQRTLMGALLTIDVHARDVTRAMVTKQTDKMTDFEWTKQLRSNYDFSLVHHFLSHPPSSTTLPI